jgi:hypothetical protein
MNLVTRELTSVGRRLNTIKAPMYDEINFFVDGDMLYIFHQWRKNVIHRAKVGDSPEKIYVDVTKKLGILDY